MFGEERITRKCVITLTGGYKVVGTLSIPKPKKAMFPEEMDNLATEYAVRNSIYRVGDKVIVNDSCFANEPCTIINIKGIYNVVHEKGVPSIVYDVRLKFDNETYQVRENDIVGYE